MQYVKRRKYEMRFIPLVCVTLTVTLTREYSACVIPVHTGICMCGGLPVPYFLPLQQMLACASMTRGVWVTVSMTRGYTLSVIPLNSGICMCVGIHVP